MSEPPAVLLMRAEGASALERALVSIAESWGRTVAPEAFSVARPGDRLRDAGARLSGTALLVIWPWLAHWRPEHAAGALGDLEAGCDLVLGPTVDGDFYLLGLRRPLPGVLEHFEGELGDDAVGLAARLAVEEGIEIGLLRAERPLRTEADFTAALADPLTPPEIAALLRGEHG